MIFKKSLSYLIISIIAKAFSFGIIVLLPKFLSAEEFGNAAIYITSISFISIFISFGTQSIVPKYFFKNNLNEFRQALGSILIIVFLIFFIFTIIALPLAHFFINDTINVLFVMLSSVSLTLINICLSYYRASENIKKYATVELSLALSLFLLPIVSMLLIGNKAELWLITTYVSYVIVGFISTFILISEINPIIAINKNLFNSIINVCTPLIPHSLALVIIASSDRFLVKGILGAETLAIYIVANNFAMIVKVFSDAFMKAWSPYYFKHKYDNDILNKAKMQFYFILLFISIIYNLIIFAVFDNLFDSQYSTAKYLVAPLSFAYFIASFYQISVPALIDKSMTSILSRITPLCALINLGINFILLERFGIWIAIISTTTSYILLSVIIGNKLKNEK